MLLDAPGNSEFGLKGCQGVAVDDPLRVMLRDSWDGMEKPCDQQRRESNIMPIRYLRIDETLVPLGTKYW